MTRALAPLILTAVLLTACGGDGGAGSEKNADGVRATMRASLEAFRDKDFSAFCDLMTKEARAEVTENTDGDCAGMMTLAAGFIGEKEIDKILEQVDDAEVKIDGNTARAAGVGGEEDDSVYVWQDGKWLIGPDGDTEEEAPEETETEAEEPAAEPAEVELAEEGFQQSAEALFWGGVVKNATAGSDAEGVTVNVNALDAKGDVIASEEITVGFVPGGAEMSVGGEIVLEEGGEVKDVETEVEVGDQSPASGTALPAVKNARFKADEFGGFTIRAQLTNDTGSPLSLLTSAFAVMRNRDGDVVGGVSSIPLDSDLADGKRRSIEISGLNDVRGVVDVDVSIAPEWAE